MIHRIALGLMVTLLPAITRAALKVDVGPDNGRKDVLTPTCDNWLLKDGPSASKTFGEITVTLRQGGKIGDGLTGGWWKAGLDTGATFSSDGIGIKDGDNGGELELVISGLAPGKHSVASWHSSPVDVSLSAFDVLVDGKPLAKNVRPSKRVTNDYDAASTYVEFDASSGKDVVFTFKPTGSGGIRNIILNGFAIDAPDPSKQATNPAPAPRDERAPESPVLSWKPSKSAASHKVYLGSSADTLELKGDAKEAKFDTAALKLNANDNYYWRVDSIASDNTVTPGEVWSFRVRHLAFPGAEGYGRFARGRGGKVFEVTTLEDSGPGSLREAVEAEGPRTVVFRVGGTIRLKDKLVIRNPYITVAGQTAPGDGICIGGYTFGNYGTHDSIIRYVRIRISDEAQTTMDGTGFASSDHCIMDHCSVSWSIDEGVSSRGAKNITFQRGLVAQALNVANHKKYQAGKGHSFAGSISGNIGSFHHNLLAHCAGRNWSLAGGLTPGGKFAGYLDLRNNVVYNWEHRTNDGGVRKLNLINNYYIPGPATRVFHLLIAEMEMKVAGDLQQYFVAGNVMEGYPQYDADNWKNGCTKDPRGDAAAMKLTKPFCEPYVTTQSAKDAHKSVIADVGANWPRLDSHDAQVLDDVINRKTTYKGSKTGIPGIINSQTDCGGWPVLKNGPAPVDTDHDGMPDDWEKSNKLNPNDPADGNADSVGDGYTNLERYLNGIVSKGA